MEIMVNLLVNAAVVGIMQVGGPGSYPLTPTPDYGYQAPYASTAPTPDYNYGGPVPGSVPGSAYGPGYGGQSYSPPATNTYPPVGPTTPAPAPWNGVSGRDEQRHPHDSQENWVHGYHQEMPAYRGHPVFLPYNYKHVLSQSQAATAWGLQTNLPYSQQFWHKYQDQAAMLKLDVTQTAPLYGAPYASYPATFSPAYAPAVPNGPWTPGNTGVPLYAAPVPARRDAYAPPMTGPVGLPGQNAGYFPVDRGTGATMPVGPASYEQVQEGPMLPPVR